MRRIFGHQYGQAVFLREVLHTRGDFHGIPDGGIGEALLGAEIYDANGAGIEANPHL